MRVAGLVEAQKAAHRSIGPFAEPLQVAQRHPPSGEGRRHGQDMGVIAARIGVPKGQPGNGPGRQPEAGEHHFEDRPPGGAPAACPSAATA